MIVRWTNHAATDMVSIRDFIANDSLAFADAFTDRVFERIKQFESFPESGQMVPDYEREDIREMLAFSFRILYQILDDHVRVLTVIHGANPLPASPPIPNDAG